MTNTDFNRLIAMCSDLTELLDSVAIFISDREHREPDIELRDTLGNLKYELRESEELVFNYIERFNQFHGNLGNES